MNEERKPESGLPLLERLPVFVRWVLVAAVVILLLGGAYYFGAKFYYRVDPLELGTNQVEGTPYGPEEYAIEYQEFLELYNAAELECQQSTYIASSFENELYVEGTIPPSFCNRLLAQGKEGLKNLIIFPGDKSYGLGAASVTIDGVIYLVELYVSPRSDRSYYGQDGEFVPGTPVVSIFSLHVKQLKDVKTLSSVSILPYAGEGIVKFTGVNEALQEFERYITISYSTFGNPAYKNADGSFSQRVISKNDSQYYQEFGFPADVTFILPSQFPIRDGGTDRDLPLEQATGVTPLYHQADCNVEETYADRRFVISESATIDIHLGFYSTFGVTSTRMNYAPEDWGKVLKKLTPSEFRNTATSLAIYNSPAPVQMRTIAETDVKVIGPIQSPEESYACTNRSPSYQYQAVKGNAVVSFVFWDLDQTELNRYTRAGFRSISAEEREAIVADVLRTITITPR